MAGQTVTVDGLAAAVMDGLKEYADLASDKMKSAVKKSAKTVRDDIKGSAPIRTGRYAGSWTTKKSSNALEVTVYSPSRYMLAHLLEFGHAKRGGGRVAARPHIAAAEQHGIEQLESEIERSLSHG